MVECAAIRAWPSPCPPNTCGLPVSRPSPRNRLTSRRSSWNCCCRSASCEFMNSRRSTELERTLHDRPVAREAAEEAVRLALLELRRRERDAGRLAATDDLRVRDDPRIARLDVVIRESRARS